MNNGRMTMTQFAMEFADAAIEGAVKQTEKRLAIVARSAFEHGFRMGEKGQMNLQAAMQEYDKLMGNPPKEVGPLGTEVS